MAFSSPKCVFTIRKNDCFPPNFVFRIYKFVFCNCSAKELTDEEQDYLELLYKSVTQSALAQKSIKRLSDICRLSHPGPVALFNALCEAMPPKDLKGLQAEEEAAPKVERKSQQIVLCQYLAPVQGELA